MPVVLKNNASNSLAAAITSTDTGIVVRNGNLFPALAAGQYFYATITGADGSQEIVKVTARSGNGMTIVRAQEGTFALPFQLDSRFEMRITAATIADILAEDDLAATVTIADAGGYYTGGTVEAALQEVGSILTTVPVARGGTAATTADNALVNLAAQKKFAQVRKDVATLLADTTITYTAGTVNSVTTGDVVQTAAEGFSYSVAASGASDQHVTTAGGVKLYVLPEAGGRYNVKAFGARGDGATNDTAAIQTALNVANGVPDWIEVVVPVSSGKYIFTELSVRSKTIFASTGGALKLRDATCVNIATNYYPINNLGATSVWFRDLVVDGNAANNTLFNLADAITCVGTDSRVTGCYILNAPDSGIMFSGANGGLCADNRIENASDTCIYVNADENSNGLHGAIVRGNVCTGGVYGGISIKRGSAHLVVSNNTIRNCGNAITFEDFGAGLGGNPGPMIIEGNLARDIGYMYRAAVPAPAESGLALQLATNVIARGNHFHNVSGACLTLDGATGCIVEGNVFTGYVANPLTTSAFGNVGVLSVVRSGVTPANNVVSNNIIRGVAEEGMYLNEGTNNTISGNSVYNLQTTYQAIRIGAAFDNNIVVGNSVNGNTNDITVATGAVENIIALNKQANGTGTQSNGIRRFTGATSPVGNLVPNYSGEFVFVTSSSQVWFASGATNVDWVELTAPRSVTAASIASAANEINTQGKYTGRIVFDTTNNRLMVAAGSAATSVWWVADGSASVTPV